MIHKLRRISMLTPSRATSLEAEMIRTEWASCQRAGGFQFTCSYGIGGSLCCQPEPVPFPDIRWQFLGALPITEIEPPPAFPANDELLLKSLERTAIEAVRFNGTEIGRASC